jgi:hypothetical protein
LVQGAWCMAALDAEHFLQGLGWFTTGEDWLTSLGVSRIQKMLN